MTSIASSSHAPVCPGDGTPVASFEIRRSTFLDPDGVPIPPLPPVAEDAETLVALYRSMVHIRTFDAKAIAMQRTGQIGTYPSCQGEEAIGIGVASAMTESDVLAPTYREQGAQYWRGVTMAELFLFWSGDERGNDFAGPRQDFPVSVPIATHALHAAGAAMAMKLRGEKRAAVCFVGDGATSEGDFYEAINAAGTWSLPAVFIVVNNGWAISVPRTTQSAAETLAQKAIAAGMPGEQVDGNDVIAVRTAAEAALARARAGEGPSLIEALTYRLGDHTTADDASRYREEQEVSAWWARDPVARLRKYLGARSWWSKENEEALLAEAKAEVEAAQAEFLATPPQPATAILDYIHETLPAALEYQRRALEGGDDA